MKDCLETSEWQVFYEAPRRVGEKLCWWIRGRDTVKAGHIRRDVG